MNSGYNGKVLKEQNRQKVGNTCTRTVLCLTLTAAGRRQKKPSLAFSDLSIHMQGIGNPKRCSKEGPRLTILLDFLIEVVNVDCVVGPRLWDSHGADTVSAKL